MAQFSDDFIQYYKSDEWQKKRNERIKIDNFRCQKCNSPFNLQVHHLTYKNFKNEDIYNDLITLCDRCHQKIETNKKMFKEIEKENITESRAAQREKDSIDRKYAIRNFIFEFVRAYGKHDVLYGGKENLCDIGTIKKYLDMFERKEFRPVQDIQTYFRDQKIEYIYKQSLKGAPPDFLLAKGMSPKMVKKYYGNKEECERILKHKL